MKVCHCRNFDEAAALKVIQDQNIEKAEDIHPHICGEKPECGTCLGGLQSLVEEFQRSGTLKSVKDISRHQRRESVKNLIERFAEEEELSSENTPEFKARYLRLRQS